ncbi:DUF393 domain-containing protein [Paracrocinitomix mangrovi]|uniref:thiol-disulfide oxidoreductase DCC family protein n=1 Tax=Paracrocinitomix mangrovi TaxID=2862509 RepID=UPI001C8EC2F2|nr:DUF393 domain-containing protein [Paracrocinitomix mangrovi]UKN02171.1 DUF393 domain-containing protein [Paracrocinitomix mangrovi]
METKKDPIVFYDGDCGFCNTSVQFILDKRKTDFYFVPLQSDYAKEKLGEKNIQINLDTIYFIKNGKLYDRSSAALQICKGLKGGYPLMMAFYIVPKFIRDVFYNAIAKRRHKIKDAHCVLPTVEERKFFLSNI